MLITCKKCKIEKGKEDFYWKKSGTIYEYTCKQCLAIVRKPYQKLWRQTEKGKESGRKKAKKYSQTKKGKACKKRYSQTEKAKETVKKYQQLYLYKEYVKKYKQTEEYKKSQHKYTQTEKGKFTAARRDAKRRERVSDAPNTLTLEQWNQILTKQNNCCNGCNTSFKSILPTKDHVIAVTNGGGLTKDNTQALCKSCNSIKGGRTMSYLIKRLQLNN